LKKLLLLPLLVLVSGCHTDMWRQPKHDAYDASDFFPDGQANRPLIPDTIARGKLREDDRFFTGVENKRWIDRLPVAVTKDLLLRGQERFNIFCSPCHGQIGDGNGMIAQRGLNTERPVSSLHTQRLREMPVGHFYDVITNGYGAMYSYASRVEPQDRWAIVAYIRALQFSQNAKVADADPASLEVGVTGSEKKEKLAEGGPAN